MRSNNKGMTVVEVLVAMAIFSIVVAITYGMYISNIKTISKTEIKSMLQTEAQYVQGTLTHIGMQSSGIEEIDAIKITDSSEFNEYYDVKYFDMKYVDNKNQERLYRVSIEDTQLDKNKQLKLQEIDETTGDVLTESVLTDNIYSFKIKSISTIGDNQNLEDSKSIEFFVELGKQKGFSNVKYDISTLITFRNK